MHIAGALMATVLALAPASWPQPSFVEPMGSARPVVSSYQFGMHAIAVPPEGVPGMTTVRLWDTDTTWRVLNPAPGVYRWDTLDARIQEAIDTGTTVLMVLGGTPEWAATTMSDDDAPWVGPGSASPPRSMSDWWAFVDAVVKRYGGRIEAYQIWNEPWDSMFWRGSWDTLARMTKIASFVIREWDGNALIVSAPLTIRGPRWAGDARAYIDALYAYGMPVDAMSVHAYLTGPPGPSTSEPMRELRHLLDNSRAAGLPLWQTEVNFRHEGRKAAVLPNATERTWLARAYLDAIRMGVARVYWYAYGDVPDFLAIDVRKRRVAPAFAAVSDWMAGSRFSGCADIWQQVPGVTACSFVDRNGLFGVALWSDQPQTLTTGTGTARDLEGRSWTVDSELVIGAAPIWFTPSTSPD